MNTYAYVAGNPTMLFDPYGLWAWGDPVPQDVVDSVAGFGDAASLGLTEVAREVMENSVVDECSRAYKGGGLAAAALGGGRLAYAGLAKAGSVLAASGVSASSFRSSLRWAFGGGKSLRPPNLGKYASDDALRNAAGRTNPLANAYGAGAAAKGASEALGCGCN